MRRKINPSPLTKRMLSELGVNIKLARRRRKLSIKIVAQRVGVAINTVVSVERGDPGVSIGAVVNVLHSLGLAEDISKVAKDDVVGRKIQDSKL